MSKREQFVQPAVEVEKPVIPESVSKLYEQYGLDFEEEYLKLVRQYNEAGVLEILPDSEELGVVSTDGREIVLPDVREIAITVNAKLSSKARDLMVGDKNRVKRDLRRLIKTQFRERSIKLSDQFQNFEVALVDGSRSWSYYFRHVFTRVPVAFQVDVFMKILDNSFISNFVYSFDKSLHSELALLLIDSGRSYKLFENLEAFSNLSEEVAEVFVREWVSVEDRDKRYFSNDVDWEKLEKKYRK